MRIRIPQLNQDLSIVLTQRWRGANAHSLQASNGPLGKQNATEFRVIRFTEKPTSSKLGVIDQIQRCRHGRCRHMAFLCLGYDVDLGEAL